jgi:hypothetical protein
MKLLASDHTKVLYYDTDTGYTVITIPDIESVNYGRGVGYDVIEHVPPQNVHRISATEIRNRIAAKDDSWKELVDEGAHELLIKFLR